MIYIVEDDSAIRELEQYALQSNGYEAVGFESSEPFWQAVHTTPPELVILDVMLPGEDGFSILKKAPRRPFPAASAHHHDNSQVQRAGHRARPRLRRRRLHHQALWHHGVPEPGAGSPPPGRARRHGPTSTASGRSCWTMPATASLSAAHRWS